MILEFRIRQYIHKINLTQKRQFIVTFNLKGNTRKSKIIISRPHLYTLIAPEVILEDKITIENRGAEECLKRYQDLLFIKLKNDILLRGQKICIYQGKGLITIDKRKTQKPKYERKYASKKKNKDKIDTKAQVSKETYCTCNKHYYYVLPRNPKWTDQEYEAKITENEMIECTRCQA